VKNEAKNYTQKFTDFEKKINKLEQNLNEKASIITKKNDTIETLTEQIENLNKKVKNLENKKGQFNVIHESLCSRCSNTLEESFIATDRHKTFDEETQLSEKIANLLQRVMKNC
jgi:chromosome segregation ATPase